jgi:ubiquinone/menaquinone biosynthesis C-methylase UbiE
MTEFIMANARQLDRKYDRAAGKWRDKMRLLGYYDGYLGFLTAPAQRASSDIHVADIGSGTGAFAEAWVAANGVPWRMTLLEPSKGMMARGAEALAAREVTAECLNGGLEDAHF